MSAGIGGINVDGAAGAAAGGGISAINISAGTTSNNLTAFTLASSNGVKFGLNASTVTAAPIEMSYWRNFSAFSSINTQQSNTLVSIAPFFLYWPVAFSNVMVPVSVSAQATTNNTSSVYLDVSASMVIYSRNVSTLSYITSFSGTHVSVWNSNVTTPGLYALTMTQAAATLTPGEYYFALHVSSTNTATNTSTATTALGNTLAMVAANTFDANIGGLIKPWASAAGNLSYALLAGAGIFGTAATRSSIAFSDYSMTNATRLQVAAVCVEFRNQTFVV